MLIVDTPFPPYLPKEYSFKGVPCEEGEDTNWSVIPESYVDSHGEKPVLIKNRNARTDTSFWLLNGAHSRKDGKPALMEHYAHPQRVDDMKVLSRLSWKDEGLQHRDGDLPALKWIGNTEEVEAREMNCFAFFKKDLIHRIDDFAYFDFTSKDNEGKEFFLYGVRLAKEEFFSIHSDAIEYQFPLWIALYKNLFNLNLENLKPMLEEWDTTLYKTLPFDWLCQVLNLPDRWNDLGLYSGGSIDDCKAAIARVVQYEKGLT